MQLTPNYNLKKPEGTDPVDIQDFIALDQPQFFSGNLFDIAVAVIVILFCLKIQCLLLFIGNLLLYISQFHFQLTVFPILPVHPCHNEHAESYQKKMDP